MSHTMIHLVARYGYVVVALLVGIEGVGIPLPGETALLAAAALAARGHLWFPGVILASALGVALGGMGGYGIGQTAGHAVVVRYGSWAGVTPDKIERTRQFFRNHGAGAVIVGRFVPVVRILTGIIAGLTEMPFRQFTIFNAIAGIIWSLAIGTAGYTFSRELPWLEAVLGRAGLVALALVVVVGFIVVRWQRARGRRPDNVVPPDNKVTAPEQ